MNLPSVKTLQARLFISRDKARAVRAAMEHYRRGDYDNSNAHPSFAVYEVMQDIDKILETCGVEYIHGSGNDSMQGLYYCNTGDTYKTTVVFDEKTERFRVSSWGDIVEKQERRFRDS